MFTLFVLFVFAWLFVKSVGLAFHVTWGLAKFVATLLFVIALPLLVVFAVVGALLPLLLPLALVAAAFCLQGQPAGQFGKMPVVHGNRRAARSCTAVSCH